MSLTPFIKPADLMGALSPETYMAIYDDDNTGDPALVHDAVSVRNDLRSAHVWVVSALPPIYQTIPDGSDQNISDLLWSAELEYAKYLAFKRRPEYTRTIGRSKDRDEAKDMADSLMARIIAGLMQIVPKDHPPEPQPENIGGFVYDSRQRVFLDGPDGSRNSGDF